MMNSQIRLLLLGLILVLFVLPAIAQDPLAKNQIKNLMPAGSRHEYEKLRPLMLKHPAILEELVFSMEDGASRYRHSAFSGLAICCFNGTITTEHFMDIAIRMIRDIKNKSLPDINGSDLAFINMFFDFGYVPPWKLKRLSLKEHSIAFFHCVNSMVKYNLIKSDYAAKAILDNWAECNNILGQVSIDRVILKQSFSRLKAVISDQDRYFDRDIMKMLLDFSNNIFQHAQDNSNE